LKRKFNTLALLAMSAATCSCTITPTANPADNPNTNECTPTPPADLRQVFDHVRISRSHRFVEFDGIVPLDAHDEQTPDVYLELLACTPDTREHESLVMTRAKPSHLHAALLLIGLEPGTPGTWKRVGTSFEPVPPTGSPVTVTITYTAPNNTTSTAAATDWIIDQRTGTALAGADWIFAGSRIVEYRGQAFYDADGTGTVVGLTTFGSEVVSWGDVFSHQAAIQEPSWIANDSLVPAQGTPVVVRITAIDAR
jgi:hypothetical protein